MSIRRTHVVPCIMVVLADVLSARPTAWRARRPDEVTGGGLVDEAAKKSALRMIPYGLFVAGTAADGKVDAFAVTWLTQASFDPPLVALAIRVGTLPYEMVSQGRVFSVTVLTSGQKELAARFFRHIEPHDGKFGDAPYVLTTDGCPVLADGLAWWQCRVVDVLAKGDHHLFLGEVVDAGVLRDGQPLSLRETGFSYGG